MIKLEIKDKMVLELMRAMPKHASRAAEIALDKTAKDIKQAEIEEMKRVFDSPVRYTLNSLKVTPTHNHNMQASVWFKEPDRMGQHYLVPQVEGGPRRLKGFEQALDDKMFVPGKFAMMTKAGNVSQGQIRQILSVLGRAERYAGYSANMTARSAKRNKTQRDYVYIERKHGRLYPGIYKRFAKGSRGVRSGSYRALQAGRRRGKFVSAVRARGLRPILLVGRQKAPYKPRLDFYGVSNRVADVRFSRHFLLAFDRLMDR